MNPELVMADMVRHWVGHVLPGQPGAADRAVAIALRCYEGGASVAEACEEARRFIGSWMRHPSQLTQEHALLRRAS